MKIKWEGYLGQNHSWSIVGQNICRGLRDAGHDVEMFSTNTYEHFPEDLNHLKRQNKCAEYDVQLTYTAMKNFARHLNNGKKNRFGIWCYEFAGKNALPSGYAKSHTAVDKILAPSQFSKQVFLDSGVPDSKVEVVPHGVDVERYRKCGTYPSLPKGIKILANVAQPHIRKNLAGLLETYGRAFTKKDDVTLVMKVVDKQPEQYFELSFKELFKAFKIRHPNHANVTVIKSYLNDIEPLYNACDIVFTMSHAEGFWFPGLEGLAAKKVVIAPRYGGQIDFLNDTNSLLIDGKVVPAPPNALYWQMKPGTYYFEPSIDEAVDKLRHAVNNYSSLQSQLLQNIDDYLEPYSWKSVINRIIGMCV